MRKDGEQGQHAARGGRKPTRRGQQGLRSRTAAAYQSQAALGICASDEPPARRRRSEARSGAPARRVHPPQRAARRHASCGYSMPAMRKPNLPVPPCRWRPSATPRRTARASALTARSSSSPAATGARLFHAGSGELFGTLATGVAVNGAAFSKDGQTIALGEQGKVELWSTATRTRRKRALPAGLECAPGVLERWTLPADLGLQARQGVGRRDREGRVSAR